jgi:hypothetical protein
MTLVGKTVGGCPITYKGTGGIIVEGAVMPGGGADDGIA